MNEMKDYLGEEEEQKLPESNAELYDCDFVFDAIGIPKPIVGFNLCEASFCTPFYLVVLWLLKIRYPADAKVKLCYVTLS